MKTLKELINTEEPGWDLVQEWLQQATNPYEILPRDIKRAEEELVRAQITTRSPMGAIIYETGGILIDGGWIRILGSGCERLQRGIMEWNKGKSFDNYGEQPRFLLIADDVLGGYFAINGGGLSEESLGKIFYLAPDTLQWEDLNCSYSDFLNWAFAGDLKMFYEGSYWNSCKEEVAQANADEVFSFFPPLWTKEGKNLGNSSRKLVPIEESYALTLEFQAQLNNK